LRSVAAVSFATAITAKSSMARPRWLAALGWRVRGRGRAIKLHELPRFL
jgi:hypothetical protein